MRKYRPMTKKELMNLANDEKVHLADIDTASAENISTLVEFCRTQILGE